MVRKASTKTTDQRRRPGEAVEMTKDKDCKHSIRYSTDEHAPIVTSVYVNRSALPDVPPDQIVVVVTW